MEQKDIDQILKQGENLFTSGNLSDAEKCFKKLLKKDSSNIQVLNDIGVIVYMRSDFKLALDYFNKALEIDERYPKSIENYSKSLIAIGDHLGAHLALFGGTHTAVGPFLHLVAADYNFILLQTQRVGHRFLSGSDGRWQRL